MTILKDLNREATTQEELTPSQDETSKWLEDGEKAREEMVSVGGSRT